MNGPAATPIEMAAISGHCDARFWLVTKTWPGSNTQPSSTVSAKRVGALGGDERRRHQHARRRAHPPRADRGQRQPGDHRQPGHDGVTHGVAGEGDDGDHPAPGQPAGDRRASAGSSPRSGTTGRDRSPDRHVDRASERAPASERPATACVAGERSHVNNSAICTAFSAAPLRRLSLLTNRARPRPPSHARVDRGCGRRSRGRCRRPRAGWAPR